MASVTKTDFGTIPSTNSATTDYMKGIEQSKQPIGLSYQTFEDSLNYFNIAKIQMNPDMVPMPYVGQLIFTRPSLNITTATGSKKSTSSDPVAIANYNAMVKHPMTSTYVSDPYGKQLCMALSNYNASTPYMPLLSSRAMTYTVNDVSIKSVEKASTFYGHTIKYGKFQEDHKIGGSISIDFRNDRYLSVLKLMHIWMSYIYLATKLDIINPTDESQMNGILDYCGSIYYLVTDARMSKLIYWEKLTGVFPKTSPFSIFSHSDGFINEDKISIEFDYGMRSDPCDPNVLMDINYLSTTNVSPETEVRNRTINGLNGQTYSNYGTSYNSYGDPGMSASNAVKLALPDGKRSMYGLTDVYATVPIIKMEKSRSAAVGGSYSTSYYLQWLSSDIIGSAKVN